MSIRENTNSQEHGSHKTGGRHYLHLAMMAVLSFIAMYALMYAMVNALQNVYMNVNQFYMAGLMTAPMVVIELILMRQMYPSKKLNVSTMVASVVRSGSVLDVYSRANRSWERTISSLDDSTPRRCDSDVR